MSSENLIEAGPYRLPVDLHYDPETHLWVSLLTGGRVRCGFDPLGSETAGDIVAISFEPVDTRVKRGEAFGNLEAAKFVGPLIAPVSGRLTAYNPAVVADPARINQDPLTQWLIELEPSNWEEERPGLLHGEAAVRARFEADHRKFKEKGMIAE